MSRRVLIVSNSADRGKLATFLDEMGFDVQSTRIGAAAIMVAVETRPDLLIVDCRSNEPAGVQFCLSLRAESAIAGVPFLVMTTPEQEQCRVEALGAGAHDCLIDPITSGESLQRLRSVKRRLEHEEDGDVLSYGDVELNIRKQKVKRNGHLIPLTVLQMKLLRFLMEHPEKVFTREDLLDSVWGTHEVDEGAVTVCIVRLRRALNAHGPDLIRLVPGSGYALDADFVSGQPIARAL